MRDSINITLTDPLRRASVRPRLDALADSTGFAAAQIAGRALLLGLRAIEQDWRLLFPASDPTSPATPGAPTHGTAEPEPAPIRDAAPCDAPHHTDAQRTADASPTAPAQALPLDAQPHPAQPAHADHEAEPHDNAQPEAAPRPKASAEAAPTPTAQPGGLSTREAAHALGYRDEAAFRQHCQRHPELMECSIKPGRVRVWDLERLRAEYSRRGFVVKGA